ncbi:MAG: hypothetical protein H0X37_08105 [Herpetosiphonaceae bacterium]|nr:hypothetical protein [Herpetosiphonaceae bacterium]
MDDSQHANRMNPQSAMGSIDDPGTDLPLPRRPANAATPDAVSGSTALSPDRDAFLHVMSDYGHFSSLGETERWAKGVFDALRHHALEQDETIMTELNGVVKVGEAPETQVREMMWGGNFVERMVEMVSYLQTWTKQGFYAKVAQEAGSREGDALVEAAVCGFFHALKEQLGADADRSVPNLGELQADWESA